MVALPIAAKILQERTALLQKGVPRGLGNAPKYSRSLRPSRLASRLAPKELQHVVQLRISTSSILDKLDSGGFAVVVSLYSDEIYAPVIGEVFVSVEVGKGCGHELFLLGECHRFLGTAEAGTGLGAHLYEDETALSLGNNVDLAFTAAEVGLANAVALFLEEVPG